MLTRPVAYLLYYAVLSRLPWSLKPGGQMARRLRAWACGHLFDELGADANIENSVQFGSGKGVRIGARSALGSYAIVMGPIHFGDDVMVGPRCTFLAQNHVTDRIDVPMNRQGMTPAQPIVVGNDVWIGAGVTILPGRRIGTGAIVAAGAVVTKDVPEHAVVGGNPARVLRHRTAPVKS